MKTKLKNFVLKYINGPESDIYSSQTLYESLFYCMSAYEYSKDELFLDYGLELAKRISESQLEDGGFDIGYDFIFGNGLRKTFAREGTSPEALSLTALSNFCRCTSLSEDDLLAFKSVINKGCLWILDNLIVFDGFAAIPYAPLTYKKIHITNATSFAISALAVSHEFCNDQLKQRISESLPKMYSFMHVQLETSQNGSYWPYFYMHGSTEEMNKVNGKIDNYHIAQQLYHHILANDFFPSNVNKEIIDSVSKYLLSLVDSEGFVPYTIVGEKISDKVDLWGYASLIAAFSACYKRNSIEDYLVASNKIIQYLTRYCKAQDYFYPIILNSTKKAFDSNFYPRSDAWVIHSIAECFTISNCAADLYEFTSVVFNKIRSQHYRGLENHTLTLRKKYFSKIISKIKR